jgi:nucleoid-associated protein YgaU
MRKTVFLVGLLVLVAAALSAQSLLDNEFYNKAKVLKAQSEQAMEAGDYDNAADLAGQAKDLFAKSDAYVVKMRGFYTASGWLSRAKDSLDHARSIQAEVNFKTEYATASTAVKGAKAALDAEKYDDSIALSKEALAALEGVRVVEKQPEVTPPPVVVTPAEEPPTLPAQYTVRLIMSRRDCLWRIAGYPWVYNDPWKWKTLYEANKDVLTDPKNANLILPGQIFTIPSLAGEKREGMYDPDTTYPEMPAGK